jgi:hypothetical protein
VAATITSMATAVTTVAARMKSHEQSINMAPNLMEEEIGLLPDFKKEFPGVFSDQKPDGLPPSQGECDHKIPIIPGKESEFKKRYVPVTEA